MRVARRLGLSELKSLKLRVSATTLRKCQKVIPVNILELKRATIKNFFVFITGGHGDDGTAGDM